MDRFMLHLTNTQYFPKDSQTLLHDARRLTSGMIIVVRDTRVSNKYVEFDISIAKENLDELVEKLRPIADLDHARHVIEEDIEKEDGIEQGISYFNNERFWECHEAFEGVWKKLISQEKELVNGIILVAASLVHFQKDEDDICISILGRAQEKLESSSGKYFGIDIDKLKSTINKIRESRKISIFKI